jgi:flagellar hook-associated protein 3 FlgL
MTMVSFGDLAQSFLLKSQTSRLKGEAGRITQELASGRLSDVPAALSGDLTRLSALSRARATTEGYQSAARESVAQTRASQVALATIAELGQALVAPLWAASQLPSTEPLTRIGAEARSSLQAVLSAMSASSGGRALFAGVEAQGPAIIGAEPLLAALRDEIAGAATAEQAMARISAWFDAPAGYGATAYLGGAPMADVMVSPNDQVWMGATAADPAFRDMLKGLTAAALVADPANPLSPVQATAFARLAGDAVAAGQDRITGLAARIGLGESRLDAAQSRNAAELMTLEMAQAELVQSDPYRLASELEAVQTNLETVYAITARLSRLSLVDFLR